MIWRTADHVHAYSGCGLSGIRSGQVLNSGFPSAAHEQQQQKHVYTARERVPPPPQIEI